MALHVDHQGTLWVATAGGLLRYNRDGNAFETVKFELQNGKSLGEKTVLSLYGDRSGIIWIGTTEDGLVEHNPLTNKFRQHLADTRSAYSMKSDRVMTIFEDRSGVFWVGNYRAGLNRFVDRQKRFRIYAMESSVYAILEDREGEVWFGTTDGLYRLKHPGEPPVLYADKSSAQFRLSHKHVESLAQDPSGDIWIGTFRGIDRYDKAMNRIKRYSIRSSPTALEPGAEVKSLSVDRDGEVWVGIINGGVADLYDRREDKFKPFAAKNHGLIDASIPNSWSIYADTSSCKTRECIQRERRVAQRFEQVHDDNCGQRQRMGR